MTITKTRREEAMYRKYMTFFEQGERNRRWSPVDDLPWEIAEQQKKRRLESGALSAQEENVAVCVETFCGVELFIPDYTKGGLNLARDIFGQAWFQLCWGYEESKHALVFKKYLVDAGLRSEAQYRTYEDDVLKTVWEMPYKTYREMACYGALQEIATYLIYEAQKKRFEGEALLHRMFSLISRDEAAHTSFYRSYLELEFEDDREGVEEDLAFVISTFEMPGVNLVPNFVQRLEMDGVGISSNEFMVRGIMPTMRKFGMDRRTMTRALARRRAKNPIRPLVAEAS